MKPAKYMETMYCNVLMLLQRELTSLCCSDIKVNI